MRKSWEKHFLTIAQEVASMGTCARRQVGCVLVDERRIILSTGFNGVPPRFDHCRDNPGHECAGAVAASGINLDACKAVHAEQNALLHCPDIYRVHTVYCTCSPCITCTKLLLGTYAVRVVFLEEYPHPEARDLWMQQPLIAVGRGSTIAQMRSWELFNESLGAEPKVLESSRESVIGDRCAYCHRLVSEHSVTPSPVIPCRYKRVVG